MHPSWRSLHTGTVHTSIRDATERLVVFGGCAEHVEIFSNGDVADMCGYVLDLQSWNWLRGPQSSKFHSLPSGRMRVAAERFGRFLLVYGGHGDNDYMGTGDVSVLKLDLLTLAWTDAEVDAPCVLQKKGHTAAATLSGGVVFGGVQWTGSSIRLVPRIDFLHLDPCV